ncbi:MAG: hypothetical protein V3T72_23275 [Thermoanaerobaculia bacterium]
MDKKLYPRLTRPPRDSFFLFGARGVGKSTWARERFPDAHRIDLLDEGLYQSLLADPSLFAGMLRARPEESRVVVDEVQRSCSDRAPASSRPRVPTCSPAALCGRPCFRWSPKSSGPTSTSRKRCDSAPSR